jgi:hypothetical protein
VTVVYGHKLPKMFKRALKKGVADVTDYLNVYDVCANGTTPKVVVKAFFVQCRCTIIESKTLETQGKGKAKKKRKLSVEKEEATTETSYDYALWVDEELLARKTPGRRPAG